MRIAMFTDTYLPARDGVVSSILLTKAQLERMGHEVFVFAPHPGNGYKQDDVYYFRALNYKKYPGYNAAIFPTNKCQIIQDLKVDIIHNHGLLFMAVKSLFASRTLHIPNLVTFHTMLTDAAKFYSPIDVPDWMLTRPFWFYLRELLERSDAVIAPTEAIKNELLTYAPSMHRVEVIPTGVDTARFSPQVDGSAIRKRYGLDGEKVLLHVGRIAKEKNLELVLDGFSALSREDPQVRLMLVGEGPAKKHYQALVQDKGLTDRVLFTGFIPDEELPQVYAACDAFTIASKFETQGLAALEAMSSGKPVAGINFRAVAEMVRTGENGYLFEESAASCAAAMREALAHSQELGPRARRCALDYSLERSAEKLVELYQATIERKRTLNGK